MTDILDNMTPAGPLFMPAWRPDNQLMGLELLSWPSVNGECQNASACDLFAARIALLEDNRAALIRLQVPLWLKIDDRIVVQMMQHPTWVARLQALPFLTLMLEENFPGLSYGNSNLRLLWLKQRFPLALANLGAGHSTHRPIFDRIFRDVFLDADFVDDRARRATFSAFALAIIRHLGPCCDALMVSGIDDMARYETVRDLPFTAMRGLLWPGFTPEQLLDLACPTPIPPA